MQRPSVFFGHPSRPSFISMSVTVKGESVHFAAAPMAASAGPPLLLLHGAGMDHSLWEGVQGRLAEAGIRIFAPDFPGHGRSGGAPLKRVEELADWVGALGEALGLPRFALAGHSMGGLVALEAAARLGARVSALALIGVAAAMPVNPDLLKTAAEDLPKAAALIARWSFGGGGEDGRAAAARRLIEGSRPGVLAADLGACDRYRDGEAAARRIACPTLILAGSADRMVSPQSSRMLAQAVAGARFLELAGSGHMPMAEAPERVAEAFLAHFGKEKAGRRDRPAG